MKMGGSTAQKRSFLQFTELVHNACYTSTRSICKEALFSTAGLEDVLLTLTSGSSPPIRKDSEQMPMRKLQVKSATITLPGRGYCSLAH